MSGDLNYLRNLRRQQSVALAKLTGHLASTEAAIANLEAKEADPYLFEARKYLGSLNATLWSRGFDIKSDDGLEAAAVWLSGTLRDYHEFLETD